MAARFGIGHRHLALLRILLGLCCLIDIARRWSYIPLFYSNDGVLSNHFALFSSPVKTFSLLYAFSSTAEVKIFFLLAMACSICLCLGWKTRAFSLLNLLCMVSVINRNPMTIYGADTLLLNLLFITQFLPLGDRWSLDALTNRGTLHPISRIATSMLLLQLAAIYFLAGIQKDGETWREGLGFYYALFQDRIVTGAGVWMRHELPVAVLKALSYLALTVEITLAFMILSPFRIQSSRRIAFYTALIFQMLIAATLHIGIFQIVMLCYSVILLSEIELNWLEQLSGKILKGRMPPSPPAHLVYPGQVTRLLSGSGAAVLAIILVLDLWYGNRFFNPANVRRPAWIEQFIIYTSFRQSWGMFSPDAPRHDHQLVIDGEFTDGTHADLINGGPVKLNPADYSTVAWDQQLDCLTRLFTARGAPGSEISQWLLTRRGGLTIPPGKHLRHVTVWIISDRSPAPEERNAGIHHDMITTRLFDQDCS